MQVRKFLRESLRLLPVNLPMDFPFADFKGLGSGPSQVIALPFQLSGAGPPASGRSRPDAVVHRLERIRLRRQQRVCERPHRHRSHS